MADVTTPRSRAQVRGLAPAFGLLLLAPICAEYLLGYDDSTGDLVELLGGLFLFVPLYGGAALIIREVARRAGRGWPTILVLAVAFGVLQPGLIDQAMFNTSYRDIDYLQPMGQPTFIPLLGISVHLTLTWVIHHAIWSISVPIAIVEALVPGRRTAPWLGVPGLIVTGLAFVAAAAVTIQWHLATEQFLAATPQLVGAGSVVVGLIAAAFAAGRLPGPAIDRPAPDPWLVGAVVFAVLLVFSELPARVALWLHGDMGSLVDWPGVALNLASLTVVIALLARWSRRAGWGAAHRLAAAGGALLTGVVTAFAVEPLGEVTTIAKLTHNTVVAAGAVALLALAAGRIRRSSTTATR